LKILNYFFAGIKFSFTIIFYLIKLFIRGLITTIGIFPYYFFIGIICVFNKDKRKEYGFKKPLVPTIMMILSLTTYFISVFVLTRWFVQSKRIEAMSKSIGEATVIYQKEEQIIVDENKEIVIDNKDNNEVNNETVTYPQVTYTAANIDYYINQNSDTVAWLYVPNTRVNYPVVQANDNDFYLNHDFYKRSTNAGWVFADYRGEFPNLGYNTIIYGHNLINKTMFGSLTNIIKSSWYGNSNNHYIKTSTTNANQVWKVFAVYEIDPVVDYLKTYFDSVEEYNDWINLMKSRSIYDFGESVDYSDKVLTLSTCNDAGTKRVVLQAKLVNFEYK